MAAVEISSLNGEFNEPVTGLREPATGEIVSVNQIDMICVPGLGFDQQGCRIGRGGGFYDTFLSQPACQGLTCGLAFEQQVVDEVPTTDHDMTVDMLITDNQVRYFKT
jgi:5-formyltetrahydrofolate cyclo-ligase